MDTEDLRLAVYAAFRDGRTPRVAGLADELDVTQDEVRSGLAELATQRHVALDAHGEIAMAHPFTAVPLGFSVMGRDRLWWGGCAWDSFALPHLLSDQGPMLVATACPACSTAHAWRVDDSGPPAGAQVAHFLVPAARIWDDVVHTCARQRIFCSEACVDSWLAVEGRARGYVMDLAPRVGLVRRSPRARLRAPGAECCGRVLPQRRAVGVVLGTVSRRCRWRGATARGFRQSARVSGGNWEDPSHED
ncbi:organomercurial lyase [Nocardioides silvaticus]|uniref:organomercurial lyase n=1 Tax=Nocardioides silvaticus TaxID=2201891 RepID=UPI001B86D987|nr:organomercurial lyase [Nocardioides silvaticus]